MLPTLQRLATLTMALTACASTALASLSIVGPGKGNVWVVGLPAIIVWKYGDPLTALNTIAVSIVDVTTPAANKTVAVLDKDAILGVEYMPLLAAPQVNCGANCVIELAFKLTAEEKPTLVHSEVFTILAPKQT